MWRLELLRFIGQSLRFFLVIWHIYIVEIMPNQESFERSNIIEEFFACRKAVNMSRGVMY